MSGLIAKSSSFGRGLQGRSDRTPARAHRASQGSGAPLLRSRILGPNSRRVAREEGSTLTRRLSASSSEDAAAVDTVPAAEASPTFEVELPRDQVQKGLVLEQIVKGGEPIIFVSAVGLESVCEEAGIVPGQVLRALSHPTAKGEYWTITGGERLRYVRDAINTTRAGEVKLVLDKELTITAADVEAASVSSEDFEEAPSPELPFVPPPQQQEKIDDRPDLYTDNWAGDQYTGSGWNELTVGLGLAVAVPVLGLGFAAATYGTLWGTSGYAYLGF